MSDRPWIFYELTNSICSTCLRKVEAKIVIEDGKVLMIKRCADHGYERILISSDAEYYQMQRRFLKPGQLPLRFNTPVEHGCPYDCGLCADHEQHGCLTLIEVTDRCNLTCPICYAGSGPGHGRHRTLEEIEFMLDAVVTNEGEPDVVQISGGEPTIHPDFFAILDMARARPIKHLMLNTNGVRIAQDEEFARRLAEYMPGFEIYLQFDSLRDEGILPLRGMGLSNVRTQALERLNRYGISTTLVVTVMKGVNDYEVGAIIDYALKQSAVRGVTLQPVQAAGRLEGFDPARDRLTLADVRTAILEQTSVFRPEDIIPVPCHPDCIAMAYALKLGGTVTPLTGAIDPVFLLQSEGSTIIYEQNEELRTHLFKAFSTNHSPRSATESLRQLLCCLPFVSAPSNIGYENVFRVIIMQFMDPYSFDVRSVKRSCVLIAHPDGRMIPFDTYNIFYREGLEHRRAEAQT